MAIIKAQNISFKYNTGDQNILDNLSLEVEKGEIVVVGGQTGCGKTTFLRLLKKEIAPSGELTGNLEVAGKVGYVFQNPDTQIVTEKVYSELAFGLENMGMSNEMMRLRIAELCEYFGMTEWYDRDVCQLSGGMKQILNLAAVMGMEPDVLVLDEATAMLDPISEMKLLAFVQRLNRDFGTTIIMSEHHINRVASIATRVLRLEDGKLTDWDWDGEEAYPTMEKLPKGECALKVKNISYRYYRDGKDVLKNLSLTANRAEIYALIGGNGTGKTTLLGCVTDILKPYKGKVKKQGTSKYLPQDVKLLVHREKVADELKDVYKDQSQMEKMIQFLGLEKLLESHPYDLSGGELQKLGLAIVLAGDPDILLLDEPTKGLDIEFKKELAKLLWQMKKDNKCIVIVSHDMEFCQAVADRMGMLSVGEIVGESNTEEFLKRTRFYKSR